MLYVWVEDNLPSHLRPWRTKPKSISPQKSQNVGALYEWTFRLWGFNVGISDVGYKIARKKREEKENFINP